MAISIVSVGLVFIDSTTDCR